MVLDSHPRDAAPLPLDFHRPISGLPNLFIAGNFMKKSDLLLSDPLSWAFPISFSNTERANAQLNAAALYSVFKMSSRIAFGKDSEGNLAPEKGILLMMRRDDPQLINYLLPAIVNDNDFFGKSLVSILPKSAYTKKYEDLTNREKLQVIWRAEEAANAIGSSLGLIEANQSIILQYQSRQSLLTSFGNTFTF
jgi:hypothetical protein